ncbi:hypothetical protein L2E82_47744 [Cichorium intybus]|uniref:Uncharacterized protein n=1 Tax=Cichorium intybus TaxID=13427 RepID=A0ACB8YW74_CICIN|nr:hypothetical protein L2E82_47744 [Cichorium intybus]
MTCCKEKAVLVAVYEEKPRNGRLKTSKNKDIKHEHHHHHHHHHHLHVHRSKNGDGKNRRAELLSYSQHLRESSKSRSSTSPHHHKPLVASTTNSEQTVAPVLPVQKKEMVKKKPSCLDLDNLLKRFAISHAKRRVKSKKKKNNKTSSKKANEIMKTFNSRTQKGASRFFSKLMATIQKYR